MRSAVNIPVRIGTDRAALVDRPEAIEGPLRDALSRAIADARKVRAQEGVASPSIRLLSPSFTWTGDGATALSARDRRDVEVRLAALISELVPESEIDLAGVAGPLGGPHREALDEDRLIDLLDAYYVPEYDGKGRRRPVQRRSRERRSPLPPAMEWRQFGAETARRRAAWAVLERTQTSAAQIGMILRVRRGVFDIGVVKASDRTLYLDIRVANLRRSRFRTRNRKTEFVMEPVRLPAGARYHLRYWCAGHDVERRREFYRPIVRQAIEQALASNRRTLEDLRRSLPSADDYQQWIGSRAEEGVRQIVGGEPPGVAAYLALEVSGMESFLIGTPHSIPTDIDADLIPLAEVAERAAGTGGGTTMARGRGRGRGSGVGTATGAGAGSTGQGGGGRGREGAGDGTARDEAEGGSEDASGQRVGRGGGVAGAKMFPPVPGQPGAPLVCASFEGELRFEVLGPTGVEIQSRINAIAGKLAIQPCEFAGAFCLNAASALHARVQQIGRFAVTDVGATEPPTQDEGNLGILEFTPVVSPAIQYMRHLADTSAEINALADIVAQTYRAMPQVLTEWRDQPVAWTLRFYKSFAPLMKWAVAEMFGQICRVLMLQLLRSSRRGIQARLDNFERVAPLFERMVSRELTKVDDLIRLRDRLKDALPSESVAADVGRLAFSTWTEARRGLHRALEGRDPTDEERVDNGGIVRLQRFGETGGAVIGIRDRWGTVWNLDQLERAIVSRRSSIEEFDPLFKQFRDLPGEMEAFRANPSSVRRRFRELLEEMFQKNVEITGKVEEDWEFAFRASKIHESIPRATIPYTSYVLQGIHLQAHEAIGEFFRGDRFYGEGINALFGAELGRQSLNAFFEFTGLVLLAVLCPPAAVVAGIATAAYAYHEATEREAIYQSLLDPDLVMSSAELEAELFGAQLGLVLAFVPEVGTILRGGSAAVRVVARRGVAGGSRVLTRYAMRSYSKAMAHQLRHGLAIALFREAATNEIMDIAMTQVLGPVMSALEREASVTGSVGGTRGGQAVLQRLEDERRARAGSARQLGGGTR